MTGGGAGFRAPKPLAIPTRLCQKPRLPCRGRRHRPRLCPLAIPARARPGQGQRQAIGVHSMPLYETVLIARNDVTQQQVEAVVEEIKTELEAEGGAVKKTEYWGLRSLAYRIKKNRK